jgi:hypothetical protein
MRIITFSVLIIAFLGITAGCDEIPPEIPPIQPPAGSKNVVIEEFSGVQCPNCPVGDAQISNLKALYGDRVIAVTMHAYVTGVLSTPMDDSKFDFRTDAAEAIIKNLGLPTGIPAAAVNRVFFEGQPALLSPPNQWAAKVEDELEKEARVGINLDANFNPDTRVLSVDVRVIANEDISGATRIHLGLIEDGMIDKQIDGVTKIEDYEHNHILRDYITNYLGDNIRSKLSLGETWEETYTYTLPEGDGWWVPENISVFGFVSQAYDDKKDVLQATKTRIYQP